MARTSSSYTEQDVVQAIRAACNAAGGVSEWASKHSLPDFYVEWALAGRCAPGRKMAAAVGFRPVRETSN